MAGVEVPRNLTNTERTQIEKAAEWGLSSTERLKIRTFLREINPEELKQFDKKTQNDLALIIKELDNVETLASKSERSRISLEKAGIDYSQSLSKFAKSNNIKNVYDEVFEKKVSLFQKENNLKEDGILGPITYMTFMAQEHTSEYAKSSKNITLRSFSICIEKKTVNEKMLNRVKNELWRNGLKLSDMLALQILLQKYKNSPEYNSNFESIFTEIDTINQETVKKIQNNPQFAEVQEAVKNNPKNFFETKQAGLLLMLGIVMNICGFIKIPKVPGQDNFFGRILALVWGGLVLGWLKDSGTIESTNPLHYLSKMWEKGEEVLVEGGWTTLAGRLNFNRDKPNSVLNTQFPDSQMFQNVQKYFSDDATLWHIQLSQIPSLIKNLDENKNIPSYLKDIKIDGQKLSNAQLIALLWSIKEGSKWTDFIYIKEVLLTNNDNIENIQINRWVTLAWIATWLVWMAIGWPVMLIGAWVAATWLAGGGDNIARMFGFLQEDPEASKILSSLDEELKSIQNPETVGKIVWILSQKTDIQQTIQSLDLLKQSASEKIAIQKIISNYVSTKITVITQINNEINLSGLSQKDLIITQEKINNLIPLIESNVVGVDEKTRLLDMISILNTLIEKKKVIALNKEAEQERKSVRAAVNILALNITSLEGRIQNIEDEKIELEKELLTAKAENIRDIQEKIEDIDKRIIALEDEKNNLSGQLPQANENLANLRVEESSIQLEGINSYLNDTIKNAINIQSIIPALNRNFDQFSSIEDTLLIIEEGTKLASNSEELGALTLKISTARQLIQNYIDSYKKEYIETKQPGDTMKVDSFDFYSTDTVKELSILLKDQQNKEILNYFEIDFEINEVEYKEELIRQMKTLTDTFESTEADQIKELKDIIHKRNLLLHVWNNFEWLENIDDGFSDKIKEKQAIVLSISYPAIEGIRKALEDNKIQNLDDRNKINRAFASDEEGLFINISSLIQVLESAIKPENTTSQSTKITAKTLLDTIQYITTL